MAKDSNFKKMLKEIGIINENMDVQLGKVYTDKDQPPFKTPKQIEEEKLDEIDFSKVRLPGQVDRFLNKFVQAMKDANLNRIKRSAVLYKVIDAAGISPQQLMTDIKKIKKEL